MRLLLSALFAVITLPAAAQPGGAAQPATIRSTPVPETPRTLADEIDRAIGSPADAEATAVVPDPEQGRVASLNAGVIAAEAAKAAAEAQRQADYQRQVQEHQRQVADVEARNARARAEHAAAVKACAAGDFSKCGGPPVPIRKR